MKEVQARRSYVLYQTGLWKYLLSSNDKSKTDEHACLGVSNYSARREKREDQSLPAAYCWRSFRYECAGKLVTMAFRHRSNLSHRRNNTEELERTDHDDDHKKLSRRQASKPLSFKSVNPCPVVALLLVICFGSTSLMTWSSVQSPTRQLNISAPANHHPRILIVGLPLDRIEFEGLSTLSPHEERKGHESSAYLEPRTREIHDDAWYERHQVELQDEDTECPFIADFQKQHPNPTCNSIHEVGFLVTPMENPVLNRLRYLNAGAFKQVWQPYTENGERTEFVLKTTFFNDYTEDDLLGDQQDAIVMERNSGSPFVLTMFAYCHFSNLVQRADGTLTTWIDRHQEDATPIEMLRIANMLAQGVKDMHMFTESKDGHLLPTIAHADIKGSQFLETSPGHFCLNDFNRASFLTSNDNKTICPFYMPGVRHKGSTMRAPEEYEDNGPQDDKIDVFSLGSTLYHLLEGDPPFDDLKFKYAMQNILDGVEPEMSEDSDPALIPIQKAIRMCRQINSKDRPWSWEVADFLHKALLEQEAAAA